MNIIIYLFYPPFIIAMLFSYPLLLKLISNTKNFYSFIFGVISYITIHLIWGNRKLINKLYIISHELSHAIAGVLQGNSIKKIKIYSNKGYVSFKKKPHSLTIIFPYFFPLYNILLLILYALYFYIFGNFNHILFLFIQGFTLSFHILNTLHIISTHQSDFKKFGGKFKSIITIISANLIIISIFIITFFINKQNISSFIKNIIYNYISIIKFIMNFFLDVITYILKYGYKIF
ncbi:MAG: M50 family metallopeptidase [Elusimicrobiales bacterium]|nr:M50 family metallopeptidase [Elusimicrobiales bacterium]